MFSWNFAKSAEAIFSRFAVKRLCKFLLKKKLGNFIHGDIDLDQLDVQLSAGLLVLTDLALNVDYLNHKLERSSIFKVKEGSIRSLLVRMPWNGEGCEVEVDDLELVLYPCCDGNLDDLGGSHYPNEDNCVDYGLGKNGHDMTYKSAVSVNIHEGVKAVAKMVKWLLTSFCVRIKNVIVAFDTWTEEKGKEGAHDALVLRVAELEGRACISEGDSSTDDANFEDFLGISHLTSSLKFKGVVVELLQMNIDDNETCSTPPVAAVSCCLPNASKPLLTGETGGFCGTVKFSIPWKNGSLDTCRVDGEVNVDTIIAKLQPITLKWILNTWELLENYGKNKVDNVKYEDSEFCSSASHCGSVVSSSFVMSDKRPTPVHESADFNMPIREEVSELILKESCFISDWVPFSAGNCKNDAIEEANLEASVDQYFECFDEMRSSQFILGSSGMWNLTCSVFSAITAASSLASGALNASTEQQHLKTNLKINFLGFSIIMSFSDKDQLTQHKPADEHVFSNLDGRHLCLSLRGIFIDAQVYPDELKSEAFVKHIVLDDCFCQNGDSVDFSLHGNEKCFGGQTLVIRALQEKVIGVLPSSCMFSEPSGLDVSNIGSASHSLLGTQKSASDTNLVKVTLFETSGTSHGLYVVSSRCFDGQSSRRTSFSFDLPPVILWLNFDLVNMAMDFSRCFASSLRMDKNGAEFSSKIVGEEHTSHSQIISKSRKGNLKGSLFLPCARIFLCFPSEFDTGFRSYVSCDQFIALDLSSPSNFEKLKAEGSTPVQEDSSWKKFSPSPSKSVHLNVVNFDVYHITSMVPDDSDMSNQLGSHRFRSHKILSLQNGARWVVLFSMLWHEDAVTGVWVMQSAKNLATSEGPTSKKAFATRDYEFASASTRDGQGVSPLEKQKEQILSSKFCLHVCLPSIIVTLCRSQYLCFFNLLNQVMDSLGSVGCGSTYENRGTVTQSSVLLECGLAEFHIELDSEDCPKSSLQRELPGSWHSLRLEISNFQLLSVSDVGATSDARFLWISHGEGKLWGSITSVTHQDVLLVSCCNSSNGRGDGESSNVLSCSYAGTDFAHFSDPESLHNCMSIVLKCITIVAPGGRLDWLDKIVSFFGLPSSEAVQVVDCNRQKGGPERLSFVVNFIDGALSYEPYFCDSGTAGDCVPKSSISVSVNECDLCIACLLSASSLTLSSTIVAGGQENVYSIRLQDVGLLLHKASKKETVVGDYSADSLRELDYVKVAGESLLNAILRINFENDVCWELNCSESHVILGTCHDTTLGLMRLASQIQQLLAPDMEESLIHLQNRWNSLKRVHGEDDGIEVSETSSNSSPRAFQVQQVGIDSKVESRLVSLMDEISEDAFLCGNPMSSFGRSEINTSEVSDRGLCHEGHSFVYPCHVNSVQDGHSTILQKSDIVEGYCLSDLRSLSELTINSHFPEINPLPRLESRGNAAVQRVNSGWYESTSLSVLENYVPNQTAQLNSKQTLEGLQNDKEHSGCQKFKGCVLLNNINVKWQLYAGSDWHDSGEVHEHSGNFFGRDETVCLELALSDMNVRYDIFPDGDLCVSRLHLSVQDLNLYDKSENAPWQLVLGYYSSKEWPRQSFSKAIKLDLEAVRPDPMTPLEEYRLRMAVLPVLLHLHQSQLDFLISFFGGKYPSSEPSQENVKDSVSSDVTLAKDNKLKGLADEALLPFFQKFDIWPIIVRVDYCPSRVDLTALSGGKYVELVNLVHWKGVELNLKHVQAAGVYGWSNVCEITVGEWLEDISQNQIYKLLQGLPAIRSFVAVGSGAAKLVSLPVKNYRKDNRLVKGLQRGTVAFLRSISVEALGLGVHLAAGAHEILLHAECILTRFQPSLPRPIRHKQKTNRKTDQPEDTQHGLRQAYESLSDGLEKTASALIHTPMKTYQRGGGAGPALVTAVRGAPAAAIAPASAAAQALRCALLGVRNSLDPEQKQNP